MWPWNRCSDPWLNWNNLLCTLTIDLTGDARLLNLRLHTLLCSNMHKLQSMLFPKEPSGILQKNDFTSIIITFHFPMSGIHVFPLIINFLLWVHSDMECMMSYEMTKLLFILLIRSSVWCMMHDDWWVIRWRNCDLKY